MSDSPQKEGPRAAAGSPLRLSRKVIAGALDPQMLAQLVSGLFGSSRAAVAIYEADGTIVLDRGHESICNLVSEKLESDRSPCHDQPGASCSEVMWQPAARDAIRRRRSVETSCAACARVLAAPIRTREGIVGAIAVCQGPNTSDPSVRAGLAERLEVPPAKIDELVAGLGESAGPTRSDIDGLEAVADLIGGFIDRQKASERLGVLTSMAPVGIFLADPAGRGLMVNPRWCEITGLSPHDAAGHGWARGLHPDDRQRVFREWTRLAEDDPNRPLEFRFVRPDGETVWVNGRFAAVRDHAGQVTGYVGTVSDVTQTRQAARDVRESEQKYRALFHGGLAGTVIMQDDRVVLANQAFARIHGYTVEELMTWTVGELAELVHPEDREMVLERSRKRQQGEAVPKQYPFRIVRPDGEVRWLELHGEPIQYQGRLASLVSCIDVTERRAAEAALRESERRYRSLVEEQAELLCRFLPDGTLTFANEAYCRYFGRELGELIGRKLPELTRERGEMARRYVASFGQLTPKTAERTWEEGVTMPDGRVMWQHWVSRGVFAPDGALVEVIATGRDITQRKRMETELRESNRRLRALTKRLETVREDERTRLAREIHDELGHTLTGLKMDTAWLRRRVEGKTAPDALKKRIDAMSSALDALIRAVRRTSSNLRPPVLDDLGLVAAVEWACGDFQKRTGIDCHVVASPPDFHIDGDRGTAVFRILQELLNNVLQHAGASRVDVRLAQEDGRLTLEVRDDGCGIEDERVTSPTSLGVIGMRERALAFGGDLTLKGQADVGTIAVAQIPLDASERQTDRDQEVDR